MPSRSEQKEKRRREIMDAGLDLFIHRGFSATKISDIAERAGMSMGCIFRSIPAAIPPAFGRQFR